MRLSDLLSQVPEVTSAQVEGFLNDQPLKWGKHKKIDVGQVYHNFFCITCNTQRTYKSGKDLYCLGISNQHVSIDVTLRCVACKKQVEAWFLLACEGEISSRAPELRVERYIENLRGNAERAGTSGGQFKDLINRAMLAYENGLGAGSTIYLRKIFELITFEVAEIANVPTKGSKGGPRTFRQILEDVNEARPIIPRQFSADGYNLFRELSDVIHGQASEIDALEKFEPCLDLVLGVVEEVNRDNVFAQAVERLGWNIDNLAGMEERNRPHERD